MLHCCLVVWLACVALQPHAVAATRHGPLFLAWPGRTRSLQQVPAATTAAPAQAEPAQLPIAVDISIGGVPIVKKTFPNVLAVGSPGQVQVPAESASNTTSLAPTDITASTDNNATSSSNNNNTSSSSNSTGSNDDNLLLLLESGQQALPLGSPLPSAANSSSSSNNNSSGAGNHTAPSGAAANSPTNVDAAADGTIDAGSAAAPALYNSSSVMQVQPVNYTYKAGDPSSKSSVLGLPIDSVSTAEPMAAWVVASWSLTNFSSRSLLDERTNSYIERMITSYFSGMAPGQVQLATSANVTVSYTLTGVGGWSIAASRAMRQLAADMAGGYDPSLISVQFKQPNYGVPTDVFVRGKSEAYAQRNDKEVQEPDQLSDATSSSSTSAGGRRMLLQQTSSSSSSSGAPLRLWVVYTQLAPLNVTPLIESLSASCGNVVLAPGVELTRQPCGVAAQQALRAAGLPVQADNYSMNISEQPMVSLSVRLAVGVTAAQAAAGTDKALAEWLSSPRNIRNAIAVSGVQDPIGGNALIRWLQLPEIWVQRGAFDGSSSSSSALPMPGFAIGVALGGAALIGLLAGGAMLLLRRRYKQQLDQHKQRRPHSTFSDDAAGSTTSERRRQRRQGKRRYLLPDPAAAAVAADEAAAAAASSSAAAADGAGSSAAAAAAAAAAAPAVADDTDLSPDQIRPHLKELGDSVTSAVRFELDDEEEEAAGQDGGAAAASAAGAGAAAAVGALAAGGSGCDSPRSSRGNSANKVLSARQALLKERGIDTASSGGSSSRGSPTTPAAGQRTARSDTADDARTSHTADWVPGAAAAVAVTGIGAGRALSASRNSGSEPGSSSWAVRAIDPPTPAGAAGAAVRHWDDPCSGTGITSTAGGTAAAGAGWQPQVQLPLQQQDGGSSGSGSPAPPFTPPAVPVPLAAAGAFAALGVPGAVVPRFAAKASPFALAYDFGDLADCAAPPPAVPGLPPDALGAALPASGLGCATEAAAVPAISSMPGPAAAAAVAVAASPVLLASAVAKGSAVSCKGQQSGSFMPSSSSLLQGVGSASIAVAPDGGFTVIEADGDADGGARYGAGSSLGGAAISSSSSGISSCVEHQPSSSAASYASTAGGPGPVPTLLRLTSFTGTPNTLTGPA